MSTIVTRSGKGSPLTHNEVDTNFTNLNTDKVEKTAADITGGTINNTTVGATTPSTGVFTTVTTPIVGAATGSSTTGLDLNVNSKAQARIVEIGDGTRPLVINGGSAGGAQTGGITATTVLAISGGGGNPIRFYTNGRVTTQQAEVSHTASAVNYVQVTGAATGGRPAITAQGSDANIDFGIAAKGVYSVFLSNASGISLQTFATGSANYLRTTGVATGFGPTLTAQGSDTNIPLVLQPKGTGALQAQQTTSTATGGNARGANAVDWQTIRTGASQVASGAYSVVAGGASNRASGNSSAVIGGDNNVASGVNAVIAGGAYNLASGLTSAIGGGVANTVSGTYSTISSGNTNTAGGNYNFIGGGFTNSGTSASAVTTQSGTMNATTAVTLSGSNANIKVGQQIAGTSIGFLDTYVAAISGTSLTLSKAATGSSTSTLSFFTPHGVVVGGGNNQATGSYSFIGGGGDAGTAANRNVASGDWSVVAGGSQNTASGTNSAVLGGSNCSATGPFAVNIGGAGSGASGFGATNLGGNGNNANATYALTGGFSATNRSISGFAFASGSASRNGDAQIEFFVLRNSTTDATATVLTIGAGAASTTNQVILPNNSAYAFRGTVIANVTGGGNTKAWAIEGAIKRGANAASTALVGTPTVTSGFADAGASTWAIAVTADTTNGGLAITFTGQAATTIRCVAKMETTEVTF